MYLSLTLAQIAEKLGAKLIGDPNAMITGLCGITDAKAGDLTFLANPKYKSQLGQTAATAVMVGPEVEAEGINLLQIDNPRLAFARVMGFAFPKKEELPGIADGAFVHPTAQIDPTATIYAGAYIGEGATVGPRTVVYPGCYVGEKVKLGEDCLIHPNVSLMLGTQVGNRVVLNAGTVVGSEGFGYERDGDKHFKIPQVGAVVIEDDVEVGSLCAIDRGSIQATVIGQGTKLDNLIHIAHNCQLGPNNLILSQAGLAGTVKTGTNVYFAGQTGCFDHIKIADYVQVGGRAVVTNDIEEQGLYFGYPARPHAEWQKASVMFYKTPELQKRVVELEKQVEALALKLEGKG
ncbi:MAG: UDP-3-O-(3-hydroxymyristoyl)glucosamine N-acyltransferase [Candidatus Lambdaproteobacteria bacterium RIFOXYD1_FULL_56_27]|uniref:UDP-3-O-acylglucosamine N-acyltransferase n=1 Tax=Candidatus Lambdaproteobacteria bacterium RIFOXYD2_FULL_56_26 TaxID=1817773 RepID=A0A1F6GQM1_9PROT|nr:MAG: UDP-3-O-(3-hydroxymyristoyl)glucosamine N-acyltransferase [Candidatus Lambdaproteobacteria bacterium RIFOXYD2_FULL_56_26]OGH04156.1 MAG: UDP-3-O-(3-hydroxymyristoyl)glucosamine N-acyltransferase [Candidatus Lambdaproteobacteria bacterium RIFOXYC1_FULL_56_13]OGH06327.1 MAG: UDP-3-O-(3-hydroxymyristoyl)glucosamine N-acyltransferase [Candidatus Lambdaproteobacteria bacterium RIFOXYD1_FULL_56_27]